MNLVIKLIMKSKGKKYHLRRRKQMQGFYSLGHKMGAC